MKQHEQGKVVASDARTNSVLTEHKDYFEITGFCSIKVCQKPYTLKLLKQTIKEGYKPPVYCGFCLKDWDEGFKNDGVNWLCEECRQPQEKQEQIKPSEWVKNRMWELLGNRHFESDIEPMRLRATIEYLDEHFSK